MAKILVKGDQAYVVDPNTGETIAIPKSEISQALQAGLLPASQEETEHKQLEEKHSGLMPTLAAGTMGALRGGTLGLSDVALTKTGLVEPQELRELKEYSPISSTSGEVLGSIGGMFMGPLGLASKGAAITGKGAATLTAKALGKTAEKSIPKLTELLVREGLTGAAMGMGTGISEVALSEKKFTPNEAALKILGEMGKGGLVGTGFGVAGWGVGQAGAKIKEKIGLRFGQLKELKDQKNTIIQEIDAMKKSGVAPAKIARAEEQLFQVTNDLSQAYRDTANKVLSRAIAYGVGSSIGGGMVGGALGLMIAPTVLKDLKFVLEPTWDALGKVIKPLKKVTLGGIAETGDKLAQTGKGLLDKGKSAIDDLVESVEKQRDRIRAIFPETPATEQGLGVKAAKGLFDDPQMTPKNVLNSVKEAVEELRSGYQESLKKPLFKNQAPWERYGSFFEEVKKYASGLDDSAIKQELEKITVNGLGIAKTYKDNVTSGAIKFHKETFAEAIKLFNQGDERFSQYFKRLTPDEGGFGALKTKAKELYNDFLGRPVDTLGKELKDIAKKIEQESFDANAAQALEKNLAGFLGKTKEGLEKLRETPIKKQIKTIMSDADDLINQVKAGPKEGWKESFKQTGDRIRAKIGELKKEMSEQLEEEFSLFTVESIGDMLHGRVGTFLSAAAAGTKGQRALPFAASLGLGYLVGGAPAVATIYAGLKAGQVYARLADVFADKIIPGSKAALLATLTKQDFDDIADNINHIDSDEFDASLRMSASNMLGNGVLDKMSESGKRALEHLKEGTFPNTTRLVGGEGVNAVDRARLRKKVQTVVDPESMLVSFSNQRLTPDEVRTWETVYPEALDQIRSVIRAEVDRQKSLGGVYSRKQASQIATILGDTGTAPRMWDHEMVSRLQLMHEEQQKQRQAARGRLSLSDNYQTTMQRIRGY